MASIDFGNISVAEKSISNEVDKYLWEPVENVQDPLRWWFQNRFGYPNLSRMALDYLSVPAMSTSVERVFSCGRQLLPFTCSRLSANSIWKYLCLGSWLRSGLIHIADIEAAVKTRKRRHASSGTDDIGAEIM